MPSTKEKVYNSACELGGSVRSRERINESKDSTSEHQYDEDDENSMCPECKCRCLLSVDSTDYTDSDDSDKSEGEQEIEPLKTSGADEGGPSRCFSPQPSEILSTTSLSSIQGFPDYTIEPDLDCEDIKSRLGIHIGRRYKQLIKACRNFDSKSSGKLARFQLRQVLRTFCLPLTAAQYETLTQQLPQDRIGKVKYLDFFKSLHNFQTPVMEEDSSVPELGVDEMTVFIHDKIRPCLHDVVRSFWLFDFNKDGFVRKGELRRILQNYCKVMSSQSFQELWLRYGDKATGLIQYTTFLEKIGIHSERIKSYLTDLAPKDNPLWEEACTKLKQPDSNYSDTRRKAIICGSDDPSISGLRMDDIENFFLRKLSKCGEILKRILHILDRQGDGLVTVNELFQALNCFIMPMSDGLFKKLSSRLEIEVKPVSHSVNIQKFLTKFCNQDVTARNAEFRQALKDSGCQVFIDKINNKVMQPQEKLKAAFKALNKNHHDRLTEREVDTLLKDSLGISVTEDELESFFTIFNKLTMSPLTVDNFLSAFGIDSEPISLGRLGLFSENLGEDYSKLTGRKLFSKIKYRINKNEKSFKNAILACDPDNTKLLSRKRLKGILDNFCFPLTDQQFEEIESVLEIHGDRFHYERFLVTFQRDPNEYSEKWCAMVRKISEYKTTLSKEVPDAEINEILAESIRMKHKRMLRDFRTLDPCKLGISYKADVKAVICKYLFRLTNTQFEYLWKQLPLNQHHCLLYEKLIDTYRSLTPKVTADVKPLESMNPTSIEKKIEICPPEQPNNQASNNGSKKKVGMKRTPLVLSKKQQGKPPQGDRELQEDAFSTFPHIRDTYKKIRPSVIKNMTTIRQKLRTLDPKNTGLVKFQDLVRIVESYGETFTEDDKYFLLEYFDKNLSGKISYKNFLKLFAWYS